MHYCDHNALNDKSWWLNLNNGAKDFPLGWDQTEDAQTRCYLWTLVEVNAVNVGASLLCITGVSYVQSSKPFIWSGIQRWLLDAPSAGGAGSQWAVVDQRKSWWSCYFSSTNPLGLIKKSVHVISRLIKLATVHPTGNNQTNWIFIGWSCMLKSRVGDCSFRYQSTTCLSFLPIHDTRFLFVLPETVSGSTLPCGFSLWTH